MLRFDPPSAEVLGRAVDLVVSASRTVFVDSLECVTLKGSAVKGDFIRGYSDFDFHVFLGPEAMDGERSPKVGGAIQFQKAFGNVDPEDFGASQFQIYFIHSERYPSDWVPPIEGTYKVLWGKLPPSAIEGEDSAYLLFARQCLSKVCEDRRKIVERFVDKPNRGVSPVVRLLGATLKGHMYSVSTLATSKPKLVYNLRLDELITFVERQVESDGHFSAFYECVTDWPRVRGDCEYARGAFREAIEALDDIGYWTRKMR